MSYINRFTRFLNPVMGIYRSLFNQCVFRSNSRNSNRWGKAWRIIRPGYVPLSTRSYKRVYTLLPPTFATVIVLSNIVVYAPTVDAAPGPASSLRYKGIAVVGVQYDQLTIEMTVPLLALSPAHSAPKPNKAHLNTPMPQPEIQQYFQNLNSVISLPETAGCKLNGMDLTTTQSLPISTQAPTADSKNNITTDKTKTQDKLSEAMSKAIVEVNYTLSCQSPRHLERIQFKLLNQNLKLIQMKVSLKNNGHKRESLLTPHNRYLIVR